MRVCVREGVCVTGKVSVCVRVCICVRACRSVSAWQGHLKREDVCECVIVCARM